MPGYVGLTLHQNGMAFCDPDSMVPSGRVVSAAEKWTHTTHIRGVRGNSQHTQRTHFNKSPTRNTARIGANSQCAETGVATRTSHQKNKASQLTHISCISQLTSRGQVTSAVARPVGDSLSSCSSLRDTSRVVVVGRQVLDKCHFLHVFFPEHAAKAVY